MIIRIQANPSIAQIERVEILTEYVEDAIRKTFMTAYLPTMPISSCLQDHNDRFTKRR